MSKLLKGVFWLIEGNILSVPYNEKFPFGVSRSGDTYVHREIWEYVRPEGCKQAYNYYPRGRVEVKKNGKAVVYMNPNINFEYIKDIIEKFQLPEQPRVIYDHSRHYKCHLDAGWKAEK
ncbi:MAG: hypothetical protein KHY08_13955 [Lachnospiraceae bacterium]|nr:hypothetical protein [Lachnospiraceae bacterium]